MILILNLKKIHQVLNLNLKNLKGKKTVEELEIEKEWLEFEKEKEIQLDQLRMKLKEERKQKLISLAEKLTREMEKKLLNWEKNFLMNL